MLNFDYQLDGVGEWYVRTLYSDFSDQEYRNRNEYKFDDGDALFGNAERAV